MNTAQKIVTNVFTWCFGIIFIIPLLIYFVVMAPFALFSWLGDTIDQWID